MRKDVAKFSDKFSHSQYASLEMFKSALNNYSMLKLRFLCIIVKTSPVRVMYKDTKPNIL